MTRRRAVWRRNAVERQTRTRKAATHLTRVETLEDRRLLSITVAEYAQITNTYTDFNLPAFEAAHLPSAEELNIIEIEAAHLSLANLQAAIDQAAATPQNDLILLRTTSTERTLEMGETSIQIDLDTASSGTLTVVGFGDVLPQICTHASTGIFQVVSGKLFLGDIAFVAQPNASGDVLEASALLQIPSDVSPDDVTITTSRVLFSAHQSSNTGNYVLSEEAEDDPLSSPTTGLSTPVDASVGDEEECAYAAHLQLDGTHWAYLTGLSASDLQTLTTSDFQVMTSASSSWQVPEGEFYDADKTRAGDTNLCWAGTSANMLTYTKWGLVDGMTTEDDLLAYFTAHFTDKGSQSFLGNEWFLTGEYQATGQSNWSQPKDDQSGSFYPQVTTEQVSGYYDFSSDISYMAARLQAGDAVGLSVGWFLDESGGMTKRAGGHAISCWGYSYNTSYLSTDPRYYTSLFITDPDDNIGPSGSTPNRLQNYGIEWDSTLSTPAYFFTSYGNSSTHTGYLESFTTLIQKPQELDPSSLVVTTLEDVVSCQDGQTSLREAISTAGRRENSVPLGTTITISDTLANGTISLAGVALTIDKSLTLDGSGITLDAGGKSQVLVIEATATDAITLKDLTITGGTISGENGGGGLLVYNGDLQIDACQIIGNTALTDSSTGRNGIGGGLSNWSGTIYITNSVIAGNFSEYMGGGIFNNGTLTLVNSTIAGNLSTFGGGLFANTNSVIVVNNTVVARNESSTTHEVADIYGQNGEFTASYSLIGNADGLSSSPSDTNLVGTTTSLQDPGLILLPTVSTATTGVAVFDSDDPTIQISGYDPTAWNLRLNSDSPARDAGSAALMIASDSSPLATDLSGSLREVDVVDIGAYELQYLYTPADLTLQTVTDVSATLSWLDSNALELGYTFEYRIGSGDWSVLSAPPDQKEPDTPYIRIGNYEPGSAIGTSVYATIYNLTVSTTYEIRVKAVASPNEGYIDSLYAQTSFTTRASELASTLVTLLADTVNKFDGEISLREAIAYAATTGTTITFDPTIFIPGQSYTISPSSPLILNSSVAIDAAAWLLSDESTGAMRPGIVISGGDQHRVLEVSEGVTTVWTGLQISDGKTATNGGGVLNRGYLTLNQCILSENSVTGQASLGGGLASVSGSIALNDSMVRNNTSSTSGGGIYTNCLAIFTNSDISNNEATYHGGGIQSDSGGLTLVNCTVTGNTARSESIQPGGGGIYAANGVRMANTLIAGNYAAGHGGGIYHGWNAMELSNCTIVGNVSARSGGGIYTYYPGSELRNTIVAANVASDASDIWAKVDESRSITALYSLIGDGTFTTGEGVVAGEGALIGGVGAGVIDPCFEMIPSTISEANTGVAKYTSGIQTGGYSASSWNFTLSENSPAINAGSSELAKIPAYPSATEYLTTDLSGSARTIDVVDMGVYESPNLQSPTDLTVVSIDSTSVVLTWSDNSQTESGYSVEYSTDVGVNWTFIPTTGEGPRITFSGYTPSVPEFVATSGFVPTSSQNQITDTLEGLSPNREYWFRVAAQGRTDQGTQDSNWSTPSVASTPESPSTLVTTLEDVVDAEDGGISLREAMTVYGKAGDTITFDASLANGTITLNGTQIVLTKNLTIEGAGVTIDAHGQSRVFQVNSGVTAVMSDLIITGGQIVGNGGGIYTNGTLTLRNVELFGNTATGNGGGLWSSNRSTLEEVLIHHNTATGDGGGIWTGGTASTGKMSIYQSTIAMNTAAVGGGIANRGTLTLYNTILATNTAPDSADLWTRNMGRVQSSAYASLIGDATFTTGKTALNRGGSRLGTTAVIDPKFVSVAAESPDFHVLNTSPAIDSGMAEWIPAKRTTDFAGLPRVVGTAVDMGVYESQTVREQASTIVNSTADDIDPYDGEITLREAIEYYAVSGDAIEFSQSLSGSTITLSGESLSITKNLTLFGSNITIDADSKSRVFNINSGTTVTLSNLVITGGSADNGAGIRSYGTLRLDSVTLAGNVASGDGGGLWSSVNTTLVNTVIIGNSATGSGGGIWTGGSASTGKMVMTHCTVAMNTASTGGGIANRGKLTANNSIIAKNTASDGTDLWTQNNARLCSSQIYSSLIGDGSYTTGRKWQNSDGCSLIGVNGTSTGVVDPIFANIEGTDWTAWDLRLQTSSPALDAGNNELSVDTTGTRLSTDRDGRTRVFNSSVDMGAYEMDEELLNLLAGGN